MERVDYRELFSVWAGQLGDQAELSGSKAKHTYRKAKLALRASKVPLYTAYDAINLKFIGRGLVMQLHKKLQAYLEERNLSMLEPETDAGRALVELQGIRPQSAGTGRVRGGLSGSSTSATVSTTAPVTQSGLGNDADAAFAAAAVKQAGKMYIPRQGSGAYAIIMSLWRAQQSVSWVGHLRKSDLILMAEPLSSTSFQVSEAGNHYNAWSAMGNLIRRGLVEKWSNPAKYKLTQQGLVIGERLHDVYERKQAREVATSEQQSPLTSLNVMAALGMHQSPPTLATSGRATAVSAPTLAPAAGVGNGAPALRRLGSVPICLDEDTDEESDSMHPGPATTTTTTATTTRVARRHSSPLQRELYSHLAVDDDDPADGNDHGNDDGDGFGGGDLYPSVQRHGRVAGDYTLSVRAGDGDNGDAWASYEASSGANASGHDDFKMLSPYASPSKQRKGHTRRVATSLIKPSATSTTPSTAISASRITPTTYCENCDVTPAAVKCQECKEALCRTCERFIHQGRKRSPHLRTNLDKPSTNTVQTTPVSPPHHDDLEKPFVQRASDSHPRPAQPSTSKTPSMPAVKAASAAITAPAAASVDVSSSPASASTSTTIPSTKIELVTLNSDSESDSEHAGKHCVDIDDVRATSVAIGTAVDCIDDTQPLSPDSHLHPSQSQSPLPTPPTRPNQQPTLSSSDAADAASRVSPCTIQSQSQSIERSRQTSVASSVSVDRGFSPQLNDTEMDMSLVACSDELEEMFTPVSFNQDLSILKAQIASSAERFSDFGSPSERLIRRQSESFGSPYTSMQPSKTAPLTKSPTSTSASPTTAPAKCDAVHKPVSLTQAFRERLGLPLDGDEGERDGDSNGPVVLNQQQRYTAKRHNPSLSPTSSLSAISTRVSTTTNATSSAQRGAGDLGANTTTSKEAGDATAGCESGSKRPHLSAVVSVTANGKDTVERADDLDEYEGEAFVLAPGTYDVVLVMDTREHTGNKKDAGILQRKLQEMGIMCEIRPLSVGDFLWIAREKVQPSFASITKQAAGREICLDFVVERKRLDDLEASIKDGRLKEQKTRLAKCGVQNCIYVVEQYGSEKSLSIPLSTLHQAMANIQMHSNCFMKHTANVNATVVYLTLMTRFLALHYKDVAVVSRGSGCSAWVKKNSGKVVVGNTLEAFNAKNVKSPVLTVRQMFIRQLCHISGLTPAKALAITSEFPTPFSLMSRIQSDGAEAITTLISNMMHQPKRAASQPRKLGTKLAKAVVHSYL
eukprot:m.310643 g.310643  ORF g.310643 m.310643 type:complete len:1254 (-) comp15951_c0_seq9:3170-6931(-)